MISQSIDQLFVLILPGVLGVQQWMGRQLLERHHRRIQLCTCRSHCRQPKRLRLRHTFSMFILDVKNKKMTIRQIQKWDWYRFLRCWAIYAFPSQCAEYCSDCIVIMTAFTYARSLEDARLMLWRTNRWDISFEKFSPWMQRRIFRVCSIFVTIRIRTYVQLMERI